MRYLVWRCNKGCGGIGDRFVGLISCSIIAKITGRTFLIDWINPDIRSAATINPRYDYSVQVVKPETKKCLHERWIDQHTTSKKEEFTTTSLEDRWDDYDIIIIQNNQPFHLLLWKNPYYIWRLPDRNIITQSHYKKLFGTYLILTSKCLDRINLYLPIISKPDTLTMHVRFGDWSYNRSEITSPIQRHGKKYAQVCRSFLKTISADASELNIFLFSDADVDQVSSIFTETYSDTTEMNISFHTTEKSSHLEKNSKDEDIVNIFVDLYIIGMSKRVLFWNNTNFARVAILCIGDYNKKKIWIYHRETQIFSPNTDVIEIIAKEPEFFS